MAYFTAQDVVSGKVKLPVDNKKALNVTKAANSGGLTYVSGPGVPVPESRSSAESISGYGSGSGSGGSGSGSGSGSDPADVALIETGIQSVNNTLKQLSRQEKIALQNVGSAYNSALNRLLGSEATGERDYNTTKERSTQDNISTRQQITSSVGRNASALQRLLGQRGAGNSSAARIVAPYGAALEGTMQLRGVTDAFGRNMQDLDTSYGDFTRQIGDTRKDLDRQKFQQTQAAKSDVATKRSDLLTQLAQLNAQKVAAQGGSSESALSAAQPFINKASALARLITDLGRQYANPISVNTPTYDTPDLAEYSYRDVAPTIANDSAFTDTISPSFYALLGGRRDRQLSPAF